MTTSGEELKLEGMALADFSADEQWRARIDATIKALATGGREFTSETLRIIAGDPPSHPNAMGARLHAAAQRGIIKRVGYRKASRPERHAAILAVWQGV